MKLKTESKNLVKAWFMGIIAIPALSFLLISCKDSTTNQPAATADSSEVVSQETVPTGDETVSETVSIDVEASFQGGTVEEFQRWVQENIYYPQEALNYGSSGTVRVRFTVGTDGLITDAEVVSSVAPSLDEEALRVIMSSPPWEPAKFEDSDVEQQLTIPVEFAM